MRQGKKVSILLLCSVILLAGLFLADTPAKADNVIRYTEYSWNNSSLSHDSDKEHSALPFPNSTTVAPGWYVVDRDLTINGRVSLQGNTHLILGDGYTLNVKGLYIPKGYTLYIYGQDAGSGKLISNPTAGSAIGAYSGHKGGNIEIHGGYIEAHGYDHCAGIGGNDGDLKDIGSITIFHGDVNAYGGDAGAGIGGGQACEGGKITIYGGKIYAEGGHYGAGIGGGNGKDKPVKGAHGGTITIWGGTITAKGGDDGAGIGGGEGGNAGTIVIHGGTVTATGGNNSAGIGCGEGESTGKGGSVTINGGTVTATGGNDGAGIGGGEDGYCTIKINGGTVTANGGRQAAAIGGGNNADSGDITIIGGTVTANAHSNHGKGIGSGYDSDKKTNIYLNYSPETKNTLSVTTGNYCGKVRLWKAFKTSDGTEMFAAGSHRSTDDLEGKTIVPAGDVWAITEYQELNGTTQTKACVPVTSEDTDWGDDWYVVNSNVKIDHEITVSGTVNLVLVDGFTLEAKNIKVPAGTSFTVWGQNGGTGKLTAESKDANKAGIGGANREYGSITINGGTVEATGGSGDWDSGSAGIGGAFKYRNNSGTIVINGGKVKATGGNGAAGIGQGQCGGGGRVTINGGEVKAYGTRGGAGIGGGAAFHTSNGNWGDVGTVTIKGGTVNAYGSNGAGSDGGAAAIGGGYLCQAGTIIISGGTVNARNNGGGAGIGGGSANSWYRNCRNHGGTIQISGGTVYAEGNKQYAAGIGGGYKCGGITITLSGGNITADGYISVGRGMGCFWYYQEFANPCTLNLSWTEATKSMSLTFLGKNGKQIYAENKVNMSSSFVDSKTGEIFSNSNKGDTIINNRTIVPYLGETIPVNVTVIGEGTIQLDNEAVKPGTMAIFKPIPAEGYGVYSVTVDGKEILPDSESKYSFTMVYKHPDVTVTFKPLTPWSTLQRVVEDSASPVIELTESVTADAEDKPLYIPAGKTVTLNLNGCTLNRGLSGESARKDGYAIRNDGTLIITGDGTITGGNCSGNGGCIVNNGTLTLNNAAISGNKATKKGGGILNNGTINVSGKAVVLGNTTANGSSNLFLPKDHPVIHITGELYPEAAIGVTSEAGTGVITDGFGQYHQDPSLVEIFHSDTTACAVVLDSDSDEVLLTTSKTVRVTFDSNGGTAVPVQRLLLGGRAYRPANPEKEHADFLGWHQVTDTETGEMAEEPYDFNAAVTESITLRAKWDEYSAWKKLNLQLQQGGEITLTEDITATAEDEMLTVPSNAEVELDLNGHTIDGSALMDASDPLAESEAVLLIRGCLRLADSSNGKTGNLTGGDQVNIVLNYGEFVMTGGTISGSSSFAVVNNSLFFSMTGGQINGNGVSVYSNGAFRISSNPVISGTVLLEDNSFITIANALDSDVRIQANSVAAKLYNEPAVITSGLSSYGSMENFTTDGMYFILDQVDGEAVLGPRINITFDSDGGTEVDPQAIMAGSRAARPETDPTREGDHFIDWYAVTDTEGTLADKPFDFTASLTDSVTLKAVWGHTVTFAAGNPKAKGTMAPVTVPEGDAFELPECHFRLANHTFVEWSVARNDNPDQEDAEGRAAGTVIPVTTDLTVTAIWSMDCYTVTFDSGDGSALLKQQVKFGNKAEEPEDPERAGFSFMGWYQVLTVENEETLADAPFDFDTTIEENTVLMAVWGNHIVFEAGIAGATGAMDTLIRATDTDYELPDCLYEAVGRVFREWAVVIGKGAEVQKQPGDPITVTANTVVKALWDYIPFGEATFVLPLNTSSIEDGAFENNTSITVVDASHCELIGAEAFKGCAMLTRIRLPKDCEIDDTAFDGCTSLFAIYGQAGGTTQSWAQAHHIAFVEE